ncbi:hypothetical protein DERP_002670 [Dermatophagoides pteronyssinus]|uniref:Uncharacterized protein n=1 Tax=Dermatophagoides pteronyssinus TaxID=6956 RepID=A0ABQ8JVD1_DERPT|nr:hypothetical protein DERP_002670 [Dermatophagoides pteronyssinus]
MSENKRHHPLRRFCSVCLFINIESKRFFRYIKSNQLIPIILSISNQFSYRLYQCIKHFIQMRSTSTTI